MTRHRRITLAAAATLLCAKPIAAQRASAARIAAVTDSVAAAALATGKAAGMSVAVVRGRDTLVMKGYGYADLEFDVPTPPDAIYEIGSVTKQFTATAVLQLAAQGKLSLDDELTRYFPDYPMQGHVVTLRRLMDHTSGIASYTSLPEFDLLSIRTLPRDSLVALVAGKPFDFPPGERMSYNNSAYFLLGLIIEKVSGLSYAEYVRQHLFEPAGMRDSRYCSERDVVKHRVHGYDQGSDGLVQAAYLVHVWPFAAGSLCSTVGDLVAWNRALHGGRLLDERSHREMLTPGTLDDGSRLRYAKGIAVDSILGHRAAHHGGDINGFASELEWFPDDEVSIAVLVNSEGPVRPQAIALAIATALFQPHPPRAVTWRGTPSDYVGTYRLGADSTSLSVAIVADSANGGLATKTSPLAAPLPLRSLGGETFEALDPKLGTLRFTFQWQHGRVTGVRFDPVYLNAVLRRVETQ